MTRLTLALAASMTKDLTASFGGPLPDCPRCKSRMVMSCREADVSEPLIFTFECKGCRFVMQQTKVSSSESSYKV